MRLNVDWTRPDVRFEKMERDVGQDSMCLVVEYATLTTSTATMIRANYFGLQLLSTSGPSYVPKHIIPKKKGPNTMLGDVFGIFKLC